MTKNNIALEFQDLFDCPDDDMAVDDEPQQHFVAKMFETAEFEAIGIDSQGLARESASIDKRATQIYQKIAALAETKPTQATLQKRPQGGFGKVLCVEITKYASGQEVHAEIGENGAVLRTFAVKAGT